jgi:hypothetical protein
MENAAPIAVSVQSGKRGHGDGRPFSKGVSGNPHGSASIRVRAAELYAEMVVDFAEMSAIDVVMLRRASLLLARSERFRSARDADIALRMSGEARRLLQTLRRHHAAAPTKLVSLDEHLARAEAAAATTDHGNGFTGHPDGEAGG